MKLSEVKKQLHTMNAMRFQFMDGTYVPDHFHVTEIGRITKSFMDCGGTVRHETSINFQLWTSDDVDHRLYPEKLLNIIALSEKTLGIEDHEIEVEYQSGTIGKYGLSFNGKDFILETKQTSCLASDSCGSNSEKPKIALNELNTKAKSCCNTKGECS